MATESSKEVTPIRNWKGDKALAPLLVDEHPALRKRNRAGKLKSNEELRRFHKWGAAPWRFDNLHNLKEHRNNRRDEADFYRHVNDNHKVVAELEDIPESWVEYPDDY